MCSRLVRVSKPNSSLRLSKGEGPSINSRNVGLTIYVSITRRVRVMKAAARRSSDMSKLRLLQVWFGVLGIATGFAVLLSGVLTSGPKAQADDQGITITILNAAPGK